VAPGPRESSTACASGCWRSRTGRILVVASGLVDGLAHEPRRYGVRLVHVMSPGGSGAVWSIAAPCSFTPRSPADHASQPCTSPTRTFGSKQPRDRHPAVSTRVGAAGRLGPSIGPCPGFELVNPGNAENKAGQGRSPDMERSVKATVCLVAGMGWGSRQVALERVVGLVGGGRACCGGGGRAAWGMGRRAGTVWIGWPPHRYSRVGTARRRCAGPCP
jgi:hypothetical protein